MPTPVVCVVGLGYVGLPLAVEFGKQLPTIGFDIDADRVAELEGGHDHTREVPEAELRGAAHLRFTADPRGIGEANVYIVTVPTPIDSAKRPDLRPLISASELVGAALAPGDTVIYESTVYPGATEEVCVPILERVSGLRLNDGFAVGYSPERINPGDHQHRLPTIAKVTSGSTPTAAAFIDELYGRIITAGTHMAPSIRVAEAAKVIENTQRDVNIALINELAVLFHRLGIDTQDVLAAAGTKWNFLPFRPGLVGGHCIGVDPYYLTHKAQEVGHHPEVILAGRRINDAMGEYVADQVVLLLAQRGVAIAGARVLVLGVTFKENTPDLRNTRVVDVVDRLREYRIEIDVCDPWADPNEVLATFGVAPRPLPTAGDSYDAVILTVGHGEFAGLADNVRASLNDGGVVYDVRGFWPRDVADARL